MIGVANQYMRASNSSQQPLNRNRGTIVEYTKRGVKTEMHRKH